MLLQQLLFKNNEDERSLPPPASSPGAAHKTPATGTKESKPTLEEQRSEAPESQMFHTEEQFGFFRRLEKLENHK